VIGRTRDYQVNAVRWRKYTPEGGVKTGRIHRNKAASVIIEGFRKKKKTQNEGGELTASCVEKRDRDTGGRKRIKIECGTKRYSQARNRSLGLEVYSSKEVNQGQADTLRFKATHRSHSRGILHHVGKRDIV